MSCECEIVSVHQGPACITQRRLDRLTPQTTDPRRVLSFIANQPSRDFETGLEIARGLVRYEAEDATRICGLRSEAIEPTLGYTSGPLVHADDLALATHQGAQA